MPKVDLDTNDITIIHDALDQAAKSAKRAQNTGKSPQIREVYAAHERAIHQVSAKLSTSK
jgi:hypothetical protein